MSQSQHQRKQKQQGTPLPLHQPAEGEVPSAPAKKPAPASQQQVAPPQPQPLPHSSSSDQIVNTRIMSSLHALMGPPMAQQQQARSASQKRAASKDSKKERLPSLHFGNLPEKFYDLDLFKFIKQSGHKVLKAFVVIDKKTQKNCQYGYAQFLTQGEADACLAALNNASINGKVITVSAQVASKPNPKANVFVRNLPAKASQQELFALYSQYGPVTKCKLECYADGTSRGFAYVQFQSEGDAAAAIAGTNGSDVGGKKIEVFAHEKKSSQKAGAGESQKAAPNNNVFVQGLPKGTDEAKLKALFAGFGEISSALVQNATSDDTMANNGFVCFVEGKNAGRAIEQMHKKRVEGTFLLVCPHVAKRENDMANDKTRAPIQQNMKKCFDSNLFVRNIPFETPESEVEQVFAQHGTIISVKSKTKKNSAGPCRFKQAFVLYETVEMAQNAIRSLDQTRPFGLTPIEVQFWVSRVDLQQEREDRQKQEMKRLIQSGLHDLQAQFFGAPPQGRRGRGVARGGRPQAGQNRPQQQPRKKSAPKSQERKAQPQPTLLPLPQVDKDLLAATESLNDRKQLIGNAIYAAMAPAVGEHAGKITGMLLDEKVVDLNKLTSDQKYFSDLVGEAQRLLQKQPQ